MKLFNAISVGATLLVVSFLSTSVQAQSTFHKTTKVSFSGPVEIPGKILPAGDYTFQIISGFQTQVVVIRDKDGANTIATLLTIPDYRLMPSDKPVLLFRERSAGSPEALRAWFYTGENYGHEFVYPKKRAVELASANQINVPSYADNTADNNLGSTQVSEATPGGGEEQVATTTTPAPSAQSQNSAPATYNRNSNDNTNTNTYASNNNGSTNNNLQASNQPLPKTASQVFSIAFAGGILIVAGFALGLFARRGSLGELR